MKPLRLVILLAVLPVVGGLMAGCDGTDPIEDTTDLDETLTALITRDGQRKLSNFILPNSDDFAAIPQDPRNPLTADKVQLGKLLFHETALATNPRHEAGRGTYSCATCHHAEAGFQAGRRQGVGDGGVGWGNQGEGRTQNPAYAVADLDVQPLRSPTVLHGAYQPVMMWSGALGANWPNEGTEAQWQPGTASANNHLGYDGLETQAIAALVTHRMDRLETSIVASHPTYTALWDRVFPQDSVSMEPAGLAIAAYERTLLAYKAPFQRWLRGEVDAMTAAEKRGAIVFFGKANCELCHTGPALNQMAFYALGMPDMQGPDVFGDVPENRGRGGFLDDPNEDFKFKVPQLYNLKDSPFYGHGGTFRTLREVVDYYNDGIPAQPLPEDRLPDQFKPLALTPAEIDDLVLFLTESLYDSDLIRYVPNTLPSGNCTPANDPQAQADLGC